MMKFFDNNKT